MSKIDRLVRDFLPALGWMALVFIGSTDLLSSAHTARLLVPLLRWLKPDISPAALHTAQLVVRKCGHVTEYATLSILMWRAVRKRPPDSVNHWRLSEVAAAFGLAVLYAASDEYHQTFYPSRYASVYDVLIDAVGASLGMLLLWVWGRWRKRW